jgi:DNA-binding MarR family transcriptional regulator
MADGPTRDGSKADAPLRMSLLYQLYLTNQAARGFMRLALRGTDMTGEAYALYSYLFGNGPRTLTQAARDFGLPISTLSTLLAPMVEAGEIERRPHPRDRRARLLALTDAGRARMEEVIPAYSVAYRQLLAELDRQDADVEALFTALGALRSGIARTNQLLAAEGGDAEPGPG